MKGQYLQSEVRHCNATGPVGRMMFVVYCLCPSQGGSMFTVASFLFLLPVMSLQSSL